METGKSRRFLGTVLLALGLFSLAYTAYVIYIFVIVNDFLSFMNPSYKGLITIIMLGTISLSLTIIGLRILTRSSDS